MSESFEPLCRVTLEARQLVNDHHVKRPAHPVFLEIFHKPHHVLAVDHVDVSISLESCDPLLCGPEYLGDPQVPKMIPLTRLPAPRVLRDL